MAGSRASGAGKGWLDAAMAALSAGSIAFAMFAMPQENFEQLVAMTGLGGTFEAAQPPLGQTARLAAAAAAGAFTFLAVWLLLRALGKPARPKPKRRKDEDEDLSMAPPRLRRVDAHPDAPSRRPLFAGSELGDPDADIEEAAETFEAEPAFEPAPAPAPAPQPAPAWDRPMPRFLAAALEQPQDEPELQDVEPEQVAASAESEPEPEPAPRLDPEPAPEPEAELAPQPELEPEPKLQPEPEPEPEPGAQVWQPQPAQRREPEAEPTIAELMQRLERAIARRQADDPQPLSPPQHVNDRLRSALGDLQKMARKG